MSYKFRLYPDKDQEDKLDFALDICRKTYNNLLEELEKQTEIDRGEIQHKIVELKEDYPNMKKVYSKTLQHECYKLFSSLSALSHLKKKGRKVGRLKYKKENNTMTYNQSGFKLIERDKRYDLLKLSKIGRIRIMKHREVKGKIKQVEIKKGIDKWYAIITTDHKREIESGDKVIGIDLGINHFLVDSEENKVEHPHFLEKSKDKLTKIHKELSRKEKGSNNYEKCKKKLQKEYIKLKNRRRDWLHKLSTKYIENCKVIVIEKLEIKKMMMKKYYNAKNIADSCWRIFIGMLKNKAKNSNVQVIEVNPKDTTKKCSGCGNKQDMPLYKRKYKCENCGLELDRDYNSAINILTKGLGQTSVEKSTPTPREQVVSVKQEAIS